MNLSQEHLSIVCDAELDPGRSTEGTRALMYLGLCLLLLDDGVQEFFSFFAICFLLLPSCCSLLSFWLPAAIVLGREWELSNDSTINDFYHREEG